GPAPLGNVEADALQLLRRVEVAWPLPDGDRAIDTVVLGRDAHLLAAPPGDRPHIGVLEALLLQQFPAGIVNLGNAPGDGEAEHLGRIVHSLIVLGELEYLTAISALAFEDGAGIM